jgi:hypothetical protein
MRITFPIPGILFISELIASFIASFLEISLKGLSTLSVLRAFSFDKLPALSPKPSETNEIHTIKKSSLFQPSLK